MSLAVAIGRRVVLAVEGWGVESGCSLPGGIWLGERRWDREALRKFGVPRRGRGDGLEPRRSSTPPGCAAPRSRVPYTHVYFHIRTAFSFSLRTANFGPGVEIGRDEQGCLVPKSKAGTSRSPGEGSARSSRRPRSAASPGMGWGDAGVSAALRLCPRQVGFSPLERPSLPGKRLIFWGRWDKR